MISLASRWPSPRTLIEVRSARERGRRSSPPSGRNSPHALSVRHKDREGSPSSAKPLSDLNQSGWKDWHRRMRQNLAVNRNGSGRSVWTFGRNRSGPLSCPSLRSLASRLHPIAPQVPCGRSKMLVIPKQKPSACGGNGLGFETLYEDWLIWGRGRERAASAMVNARLLADRIRDVILPVRRG